MNDDVNILIEAHICSGSNGVRMELPTASAEDIEEYALFLCAQGEKEGLDEIGGRVPNYVWAEGMLEALSHKHWNIVHYIEQKITPQSDAFKKVFPKMWAHSCAHHDLQALQWLQRFKPTLLNYKEVAFQSVRGSSPEVLKWALENWKENVKPNDTYTFIDTVFSDAIRLRQLQMIKTVLPFLSTNAVHNRIRESLANPHVFGQEAHTLLEKAVLESSVEGTAHTSVAKRKM